MLEEANNENLTEFDDPNCELTNSIQSLFITGSYTDLTIACGADRYNVHRAIICPRAPGFVALLNPGSKEAHEALIDFPEDDPQTIKLMIHYFYYLDYPHQGVADQAVINEHSYMFSCPIEEPTPTQHSNEVDTPAEAPIDDAADLSPPNLTIHAKVYGFAERWGIRGLKTVALEKFRHEVQIHWSSEDFLQAFVEIYTNTVDEDRGMRDVVVDTFAQHPELLDNLHVQELVRDLGLCFDLMMRFRSHHCIESSFTSISTPSVRRKGRRRYVL